ncbi:MAG TPA: glutamyl-tRNA reductase, partial [Gemmatimonadaceae bacterium]|nr:glutamyl-tRNA reductase [Gemmatimonadaceae bacterium]
MQVVAVGLNHITAPLAVRERLAFSDGEIPKSLARLGQVVEEGFILSTCNRVEVYGLAGHADSGALALRSFLLDGREVAPQDVQHFSYTFAHEDAVRHLFRVAGGVDSMVLGENEILGQLRRALATAREAGVLGPKLGRLGAAAVRAGRLARSETGLGRGLDSVVSLGLEAAGARGAEPLHSRIAILGGGETAEAVIRHLKRGRVRHITVCNRGKDRAARIGDAHGVSVAAWDERALLVAQSDLVITCTSARTPVLTSRDIGVRDHRPLVCLDLGLPRDVEPAARSLSGVTVIDLDELSPLALGNCRRDDVDRAEAVLAGYSERFMEWWRARQVVPTITDLRALGDEIREAEVQRALNRLSDLTPRQRQVVQS